MTPDIKYIDHSPNGDLPKFAFVNAVYYPVPTDDKGYLLEDGSDELVLARGKDVSSVGVVHLETTLAVGEHIIAEEGDSLVVFINGGQFRYGSYRTANMKVVRVMVDYDDAIKKAVGLANEQAGIIDEFNPDNYVDDLEEEELTLQESALQARQLMRIDENCMRVSVDFVVNKFVEGCVNGKGRS